MNEPATRIAFEAGAAVAVAGAMAKVLPPLAAAVAIAWYCVQLWQSETGRNWRSRWKRLYRRELLTIEDRIAFLVLGMSGTGVFLALYGLSRLLP